MPRNWSVRLTVMYSNVVRLRVSCKQLEFKDCIGKSAPDIIGIVETERDKVSPVLLEGYMIARKEREGKGRGWISPLNEGA